MDFATRYAKLNAEQQKAVEQIDGPVLVVAGPGTGKTELLSMRIANILKKTDTLPETILCLTFTDSGAGAMRSRLAEIIGPAAYKVAIHTFHSFGTETINQHREYFFRGAEFTPADDIAIHDILKEIFDTLPFDNPLASKMGDEYVFLSDVRTAIAELKKSGLTSDELLSIISNNDSILDAIEKDIQMLFSTRVSKKILPSFAEIAQKVSSLSAQALPPGITPLGNALALSMAHAFDRAVEEDSTKPITAWKNAWLEPNHTKQLVFKDRKRHFKLRALAHVYYEYLAALEKNKLFDYDDMILQVVHALETQHELRYNLQEKYQYILVDEFQDTNLAQLRILFNLTDHPANEDAPNIMAVGDDDQAIYSFQGADLSNITEFLSRYPSATIIPLTNNYRSTARVIAHAREVITQGEDRLEHSIEWLDKTLTAHLETPSTHAAISCYQTVESEYTATANAIRQSIQDGTPPKQIAIIARRHSELEAVAPYLAQASIPIHYDRRDNVLDDELVRTIELIARIVTALHAGQHSIANQLIPELLSHPAFAHDPTDIWKLSLKAYKERLEWLEVMQTSSRFAPLHKWLVTLSSQVAHTSLWTMIDTIVGSNKIPDDDFSSPVYRHYISPDKPDAYVSRLHTLRSLQSALEDHDANSSASLPDLLSFIDTRRELNLPITSARTVGTQTDSVALLTAHKSKGLEYDDVYIIGATDSGWGRTMRSRSAYISYPANLPLSPAGGSYDERIRLFFVAMTRARKHLSISYAATDSKGKNQLLAGFLTGTSLPVTEHTRAQSTITIEPLLDWRQHALSVSSSDMRTLLTPTIEHYKLSATHLHSFLDVPNGGPQHFLANCLLHFPRAKMPHAAYGTAIHSTLQKAHNYLVSQGTLRPVEDVLHDFEEFLSRERLSKNDYEHFSRRGISTLQAYLTERYDTFTSSQKTELDFAHQEVIIGNARLTGKLDLVDIDPKARTIHVTDYKTGKPLLRTSGGSDYDKIKLHRYKQQLMFYRLLIERSRDFSRYTISDLQLQFVEPTPEGKCIDIAFDITPQDLEEFRRLIQAVWQHIMALDLPDVADFEPNYKGIMAFEQCLIDEMR